MKLAVQTFCMLSFRQWHITWKKGYGEVSSLEELNGKDIDRAIKELKIIKKKLKKFSLDKVVWDIENLEKHPPWGKNISDEISDLSNYFITSDGEDFITIFMHALEKAKETGEGIAIRNI